MDIALILLSLGALFVAGLAADQIGHRTRLPRVTLLLGCGIVAGGAGFDLIPPEAEAWYELLSIIALTMVAFLLGGFLTKDNLQAHGKSILLISVSIVTSTVILVSLGLWLLGLDVRTLYCSAPLPRQQHRQQRRMSSLSPGWTMRSPKRCGVSSQSTMSGG